MGFNLGMPFPVLRKIHRTFLVLLARASRMVIRVRKSRKNDIFFVSESRPFSLPLTYATTAKSLYGFQLTIWLSKYSKIKHFLRSFLKYYSNPFREQNGFSEFRYSYLFQRSSFGNKSGKYYPVVNISSSLWLQDNGGVMQCSVYDYLRKIWIEELVKPLRVIKNSQKFFIRCRFWLHIFKWFDFLLWIDSQPVTGLIRHGIQALAGSVWKMCISWVAS